MLICIKTHRTCDFPGLVRTPLSSPLYRHMVTDEILDSEYTFVAFGLETKMPEDIFKKFFVCCHALTHSNHHPSKKNLRLFLDMLLYSNYRHFLLYF